MMDLSEPKPKKYCRLPQNLPLPIILKKDGSLKRITATFNRFSVIVEDEENMKNIISMGYFGKARFSRSYPQFTQDKVDMLRDRQFKNRKNMSQKFIKKPKPNKVIVVPDSDSENEEYFSNLRPVYEIDYSGLRENVWLSLEEAFFLASAIKMLEVIYKGETLAISKMWTLFSESQTNFVRNYIIYFYYRSKNWVVKPGIKFGGDFLLYKQGPPFYHATYVVIIEVLDEHGKRIDSLTNRSLDNVSLLGLNRLCETAGKELIICKVVWPESNKINFDNLSNIAVQEILMKRWISTQDREDIQHFI